MDTGPTAQQNGDEKRWNSKTEPPNQLKSQTSAAERRNYRTVLKKKVKVSSCLFPRQLFIPKNTNIDKANKHLLVVRPTREGASCSLDVTSVAGPLMRMLTKKVNHKTDRFTHRQMMLTF